ncbi:hypothetical protein GIB67_009792 [Kingdonia uniflora]|uniref:Protein CHUP1, chloroplastic-like n=1 Tax=Kingdonia uniflora TaxID=39325 RepID=A0A7J7LXH1_9MAGN|nr:hypothetical protein GIB67_009792 [Kingdonia uniflora]
MREHSNLSKPCKFVDQNQTPTPTPTPTPRSTTNSSKLKSASTWGSNIVKGFSIEKKGTPTSSNNKKLLVPLSNSDVANRAKRSQVYPNESSQQRGTKFSSSASSSLSSSRDLFLELDHLRDLLRESKERELKLKNGILDSKNEPKISELEREIQVKGNENERLAERVGVLEAERLSLSQQVESLSSPMNNGNLEVEVVELRRLNKELQLQKRNLACQLSLAQSQLVALKKISQSEIVAKVEAEASLLRHTNEDLCKQVEGLQMTRLTEVEELVYLRWVNSCLRNELRNLGSTVAFDKASSSPNSVETPDLDESSPPSCLGKESFELCSEKKLSLTRISKDLDLANLEACKIDVDKDWENDISREGRRHSISGSRRCVEELVLSKRRQSDAFINCTQEIENGDSLEANKCDFDNTQSPQCFGNTRGRNKISDFLDVEKRALRIPNPPPRPSGSVSSVSNKDGLVGIVQPPPPPPPPPPPKLAIKGSSSMVQRAPQVVEFYHSLMKRGLRKDSTAGGACESTDVSNVRSNMIDEIENRSSYLLAIKEDVETQGEFVNSLIREVNGAVYQDIEEVVSFVKWLDDELCFLVDERAVLKHFDWPEKKADTLREAAFGYRDLKKLEFEVTHYEDCPQLPCDTALKKMVALSEKMERSVYNILRARDTLMRYCKEFQIPTDWMLDTGIIGKIKFGSVNMAKIYMKRVAMELQSKRASEKDPALEYILLQGVRFAFRVHQFAGGFDAETMHAFEELRNLAHFNYKK